jgi:transglutaminase-like putative cysteine protease
MNHRVTVAAAVAVVLASVSEFSLINGASWLLEAIGAVVVVALAGTLTRQSQIPAAIGATALSALASVPMLLAQSPYLKVAGVALIAACGASASGLRPLRALAGLATYLAALLLYLNVLHAAAQSFIGIVPTPASVHRLALLVNAGTSAAQYQPPVTARPGVLLVAAGSIGLAAVVVDILAVRLHRPAIAGLPLLVVYMAPIATTAKVGGLGGGLAFLLAAAGYLTLLSSDGRYRLRGWGRVVTVWHSSGEDERLGGADVGALASTGRRIGLAAVCAALIVPLLLPGLTLHQLFGGHSTGGGRPVSVGLPDPVAQLRGLLTKSTAVRVLTYRSTAANAENYLQVYVLNYSNAAGDWNLIQPAAGPGAAYSHLLPAPGLAAQNTPWTKVRTTVTIPVRGGYSWAIHFLPVPYWPVRIAATGDWHEAPGTLMIYSGDSISTPLRYTVTSGELQPTAAELSAPQHVPAAIAHSYLGFMNSRSPIERRLRKIAQRVTAGSSTAFGKAVALERWFLSSRFGYSVSSKLPDTPQGLLKFVTTSRRGFCQQFAFAMAVLARLIGIPSRVAIGFTAGQPGPDRSWVVTSADAHAWPELYFSGLGWLRFEPTPSGAGGQDTAVEPSYVSAAAPSSGTTKPTGGGNPISNSPAPAGHPNILGHVKHPNLSGGPLPAGARRGGSEAPIGWIILAVLAVAVAAPGTARIITRRRRWATATDEAALASAAWQELCADLEDYGMRCGVSESPRAVAQRIRGIAGIDEAAGEAVARVATVVEHARYAPAPVMASAGTVRADVSLVRRALARTTTSRERWRARLLPASTLQPLLAGLRQATGLLTGWTPAGSES